MISTIIQNQSHKHTVDAHRDDIIQWFSQGASNLEVANYLNISIAALHRHTMHWEIKKVRKHRGRKQAKKLEPFSNKVKHLAVSAKWTKTAL